MLSIQRHTAQTAVSWYSILLNIAIQILCTETVYFKHLLTCMALAYILTLYMNFQLHNLVWKHVGKELSNNDKWVGFERFNIFENFDVGVYIVFEQLL